MKNFASVAFAVALVAASAGAQTRYKSGFNVFSRSQDVEIGQQSAAQAERELRIIDRGEAATFVAGLGAQLAAHAPETDFEFQFKVVDSTELNAFALPGGPVYVNRGVLEAARTDGEVAGVLAHEIAHVALRHGTQNASKAYLGQAGLGLLGGLIGGKGDSNTSEIVRDVGGFGLNTLFLKYSRQAETEADVVGAQMLVDAGYNPQDMIDFFQTIARADKSRTVNWLSSHPTPERRIERIQREAQLMNVPLTATTSSTRLRQAQAGLRGVPSSVVRQPTTPTTTVSGIERPSSTWSVYRSPSRLFRIGYPDNWEVVRESDTGAIIAPVGGSVRRRNGNVDVVAGVILNHYAPFGNASRRSGTGTSLVPPDFEETTLESATDDLVQEITNSSSYLRPVRGSARRIRLEDGVAMLTTLAGTSPTTRERERVTVVTRELEDEHLVYMLFVTPERDASLLDRVLQEMVGTLQIDEDRPH